MNNYDRIKEEQDKKEQFNIELNQAISEQRDYLISKMPLFKLESALIDCIQSKLDNRHIISELFDNSVGFQEWIAGVRDELCEWLAIADVAESNKDDRD